MLIVLSVFLFFGPPDLYTKTSNPDFCHSCHVMDEHFEHWFMTGVHRNIWCVDCHLPNDTKAGHFVWKGIDGMKDVILFHTNLFPEPIRISDHGRKTIQRNCVRCHGELVSEINTEGRNCWECHRRIDHTFPQM